MSDAEVATAVGMSIHEYSDIEQHADEFFTVTHLSEIRKLATLLGLEIADLVGLQCAFCVDGEAYSSDFLLDRSEIICKSRESKGMQVDELADRIGFDRIAVEQMEKDKGFLEAWSIELISKLASVIEVPLQILLDIKCKTCGR